MDRALPFLHGIHTIMVSPLTADYDVDTAGLRRDVEFAASSNAEAIVVLGTQGEFPAFSADEAKLIMKTAVEASAGRKPVVCGSSRSSTLEALELTRYAEEIGADAVLLTPPYFSQVKWEGVYDHFARISNDTSIPIIIYNAPERVGFDVVPQQLLKLAELENVVAVKQASRNIVSLEETVSQVGDAMAVFCGSEAMMWPALALGMVGSSTTAASFMPQYFVDLYQAAVERRFQDGLDLYMRLAPLRRLSKRVGHAAVVKAVLDRMGLAGGPVRPPLVTPTSDQLSELDGILNDLGIDLATVATG